LDSGDPTEVGGYRLRARIGSGGMGQVFLSFTPGGRAVALKVIRGDIADHPEFRARFAHEVVAAQRVNGVHIAQLLDAGPTAVRPWLATAYVAGPTVQEAVRSHGPLPAATVRILMAEIAESLRAIHAAGIVHRDLKPANVVLGADGLRVIDFGIAHVMDSTSLTPSGRVIGSPHYIAPEQVLGREASSATDVFALGALACFAATGRPAFGEGPDIGVTFRVVNSEPDLDGCPEELRGVIAACLAKAAPDRPTTAELMEICRPDRTPAGVEEWLPPTVVQVIRSRSAALEVVAAEYEPIDGTATPVRLRSGGARHAGPEAASTSRLRQRSAVALAVVLVLTGAAIGAALSVGSGSSSASGSDHPSAAPSADPAALPTSTPSSPSSSLGSSSTGSTGSTSRSYGPPPPPGLLMQWYGVAQFGTAGIDLDPNPPTVVKAPDDGRADVKASAPGSAPTISTGQTADRGLALWTGPTAPTPRQCMDLINAQGRWQLPAAIGDVVCVRTGEGRPGVLTIRQLPRASGGSTVGFAADGIVWTLPQGPPPRRSGPPPAGQTQANPSPSG
jgi:serine/threonine protein kinase